MCALHDNNNHASQEISGAFAVVILACKFKVCRAGTCGIFCLSTSQPLCCVLGVHQGQLNVEPSPSEKPA